MLLLLGNGFFSGSEIAIISARRSRIEALVEEGSRAARRASRALQDNMDQFLATVQIGVTVCGTLAGVLGGMLASRYLEPALAGGPLARLLPARRSSRAASWGSAIVYVELVLGELVPKALALRYTETIALLVSAPFRLMAPRLALAGRCSWRPRRALVLRVFGIREAGPRTFVSEEEIKHLVKEGRQQGVLDQTEMEIIHSVFEFTDTPVRKVMVPRPKIFALDADTPPDEVGCADRGERLLAHPRLRGLARQRDRRRLRQGRAAAAREAPARGRSARSCTRRTWCPRRRRWASC